MREAMRRFFAAVDPGTELIVLDREESRHLAKVLRLQVGERIELFDGSGALYTAEIESVGKRVAVRVTDRTAAPEKPGPLLIVCQGDLKGQKIDFLVEKCTELGVDRFIPFTAGRSQGRDDAERRSKKHHRRQTIVRTACKQCGRLRLMEVDADLEFRDLLRAQAAGEGCLKLMLWEQERGSMLGDAIGAGSFDHLFLMLGPEGGFSTAEAAQARAAGWLPVSLGERILRAETAALAAVAITQHLLGRM